MEKYEVTQEELIQIYREQDRSLSVVCVSLLILFAPILFFFSAVGIVLYFIFR